MAVRPSFRFLAGSASEVRENDVKGGDVPKADHSAEGCSGGGSGSSAGGERGLGRPGCLHVCEFA